LAAQREESESDSFVCWAREQKGAALFTEQFQNLSTRYISEQEFKSLTTMLSGKKLLYVLHFSPFLFTKEQEDELIKLAQKTTNPLQNETPSNKFSQIEAAKDYDLKAMIKTQNKKIRELALGRHSAIKEKNRLLRIIQKNADEIEGFRKKEHEHLEQIAMFQNLENENMDRLRKDNEEHKTITARLTEELNNYRAYISQKDFEISKLRSEFEEIQLKLNSKIVGVLNKFLTPDVIRSINEPDEVKDRLLSVIRMPSDQSDAPFEKNPLDSNGAWQKMLSHENATINTLGKITFAAASDQQFTQNWPDLSDEIVDLKCTLRARCVMLNIFYEVLSKFYNPDVYNLDQRLTSAKHKPESIQQKMLLETIEELKIEKSIIKNLRKKNIFTIGDLTKKKEEELYRVKNFGKKEIIMLKNALADKGLSLNMNLREEI
jgi:hypothetical protein